MTDVAPLPGAEALEDLNLLWKPSEKLSLAAWSERHFVLSPEYSAKSGLLELDPWQVGIFDAFTDPAVEQITLMVATQMVKTLFLQACCAYAICEDPGPILFVGYSESDAEKYSKERFGPMARDIEPLGRRVAATKSRDPNNTIEHKQFPGGTIDFVGSKAPANLARRTIRYLFCDEVDKYDASAGDEGDPISLAIRRTARFGSRRKVVMTCSPTVRGSSRIAAAYEVSDQRKPFVSCHLCGHAQVLSWASVVFDSDAETAAAIAESARYRCESCDGLWTDADRRLNVRRSVAWRPLAPFNGHAGFWISHLYSTLPLHSLSALVKDFLVAHDSREQLKVFINTDLAELWEERGEQPDHKLIMDRADSRPFGRKTKLPVEVSFLTAGVDVQEKRLEIQVLGHGAGDHHWVVDYLVIELREPDGTAKMTTAPEYWIDLGRLLDSAWPHEAGSDLPILAMSIDVGYNPDPVYTFARKRPMPVWGAGGLIISAPRTVLCTRGHDGEHLSAISRVTERETARMRKGAGRDIPILTLGTGFLKTNLYYELMGRLGEDVRIHLTRELPEVYFRGLVAEKRVVSRNNSIQWLKVYPRNEPLDTWVYAMGAFYALRGDTFTEQQWSTIRRNFGLADEAGKAPQPKTPAPAARLVRSPYLDS